MSRRLQIVCVCCGRQGRAVSRGLRKSCWDRLKAAGQLEQYPRQTRLLHDVVDDYLVLSRRYPGESHAKLAPRMGMRLGALSRALTRARRAGLLTRARDGSGGWYRWDIGM